MGTLPGHVRVTLQLPGQKQPKDMGDLPIVDQAIELPLRLLFLCHASEDQSAVESIGERLLDSAFLTWFAPKDLQPGDAWKDQIDDALERADYVLVFLSQASRSKTGYVQREIKYAFEQRELRPDGMRYIIPVLLESCKPPRRFKNIHWVELWKQSGFEKLAASLT